MAFDREILELVQKSTNLVRYYAKGVLILRVTFKCSR